MTLQNTKSGWLSWMPLIAGLLCSYGPVSNNYGFALYFLTYKHGFVKRGLIGELLSPIHFLSHNALLIIQFFFLALAFAATYFVFRKLLFGGFAGLCLAAALFSAPALLPHIGFLFAQPDVTLYILLLAVLYCWLSLDGTTAAIASLPLCCMALLVHEAFILMFYPLVLAVLLHQKTRKCISTAVALLHPVLVAATFLLVLHFGKLSVAPDTILVEASQRTNVVIQRQIFDVMASTLSQQFVLVRKLYTPDVLKILALTLALALPYFVLLWMLLRRTMSACGYPRWQRFITYILFLMPLLLCLLGHDTTRWIGAACIDVTFFVLYLYLVDTNDGSVRQALNQWAMSPSYLPWVFYLLAVGPFGATGIRTAEQMSLLWR